MLRRRRLLVLLFAVIAVCAMASQSAQTESPLRRITNTADEGISINPTISGDGRFVGFESTEDIAGAGGPDSFRAIRSNVSIEAPTFIQMGATRAPAPAVSQDGSRIAFASNDDPLGTNGDGNSEVFLYDGATLVQVTNTSPGDLSNRHVNGNFQPSISDDGRFIVFSSNRNFTSQNSDGNLEIFVYDTVAASFVQATNSSVIVGFSSPKISGDGTTLAYIRDTGTTPSANRDLVRQNRQTLFVIGLGATQVPGLALTYGRAISDDGLRVVWSAQTATNTTQVFLFDGRNGNIIRQITSLGSRATDVPLHPTISGDGARIAFATRRPVAGIGTNSDTGVELYNYDIPSSTFGRVTNLTTAGATADVISSMNDDGSVIAFNFSRLLSGSVFNEDYESNSEIYVTGIPPRPIGSLTILNRASFGNEPSTTKGVAPESIAAALGSGLALTTVQGQRQGDGAFPTTLGGTTVTVNGLPVQIFFVSPTEVHFHVPVAASLGSAEVVITNSDGFVSRGNVTTLLAAPGVFTDSGDGLGDGAILNADTMQRGPFDPSGGNLRLIIFSTGVRNGSNVSVSAGGRALTLESIVQTADMPGMDEIHVLVPAELRGAGRVDLVVEADGRDSNPVAVEFVGDVLINEFLADPPDGLAGDANHDGVRDSADDEFIELVNITNHDLDLSGYRLLTRSSSATSDTIRHQFGAGIILPACTSIVIFGGGNPNINDPIFRGAQIYKAQTGALSLTNSGGFISLRDRTGGTVSVVRYGSSTGLDVDVNQSLTRAPDLAGSFTPHQSASGAGSRLFSPGTKVNGDPFSLCFPIARIDVTPLSATIEENRQQQFSARAFDASGNEVTGVVFLWTSSNPSAAFVDQNGMATAFLPGMSEIRASGRGVTSAPAILTVTPGTPPNVVINEVDSDQTGTDTSEFVELYDGGIGNSSLTGTVVVFYNGSNDGSYAAFDLDSRQTNASGYFTIGNTAVPGVDLTFTNGNLQNGPDAVAIYFGNAADFPNGTPVTTANLIDAVVYDNNNADDPGLLVLLNAGQPQVNEDTGSNGATNSNQRCPNGSGGARNTSTYNQFAPTPDGANVCVVVTPPPTLSIDDISLNEGQTGTTTFTFTVSLSAPAPGGVTFDIATADNTATVADNDYVAKSLTNQTITAGNQTYQFTVSVNRDSTIEPNEGFFVNVTNVAGAAVSDGQGVGTIQNDDSPQLSINNISASEGNSGTTTFTFAVTSSLPALTGGITFDIATADGTAQDDNPASEDNDYVARSLTGQTITAGNNSYTFDVTVNGDLLVEPNETFFVNLSNATGATISDPQGQGTIQNDDAATLVISQVYAGGGNAGAQFTNDFVELFNRGTTTVNFALTPYSVQYAGATASFGSSKVDLITGTMAPGQYFLVQLSGGANGVPLPTPDAIGTIAMAATAGKVALVAGTTALSGSGCPLTSTMADFVGYGTTADCFDGAGRAPAPNNTTADLRRNGGCSDTNNNAADFRVVAPFPRNTSSPFNSCVAGAPPNLTINDVHVIEGNAGTVTATFTVSLSAPAPSTDTSFDIATQDNTATTANSDYVTKTLTNQLIPAGQQNYTFTVTVNGDVAIENDETFFVNVTNASGATVTDGQGEGRIQNDDLPSLSMNDVSINEGNGGPTTFSFTVSLSNPAPTGGVTFDIATADGTAQDGNPGGEDSDYVANSLTSQTIPAGSSHFNFDVTVNGDLVNEANETFSVNVTNVSGSTVADAIGQGTILNDDSPSLTINDVSEIEGDAGTTTFTFTVTSSLPAPAGGITFDIDTADGTAQDDTPPTEDSDYLAHRLTGQTITAGNTSYTFDVTVNGDTLVESNETFLVNLANVVNANVSDGSGQGTIQNDDTPVVVISQLYGGGGNGGAPFANDFIEVFNRGTTTVNLTGWSVQYIAATGTGTWSVTNLSGTLIPGHYYLVQEASAGAVGSALPTPDATGTIAMAATAGKVALVNTTTPLSSCPVSPNIIDLVGYGTTANCSETAPAPAPSNTTADLRKLGGCTDTNNNSADFLAQAPAPRNTASPLNNCNAPPSLTIDDVSVAEGDGGTIIAHFTVSLSTPAPAGGVTFDIATQDDSATLADNDYLINSLTSQTITAGNQTHNFAVTVNGDVNVEPDETFFVNVTNVTGASIVDGQGVGTIQDDDSAPLPNLSVDDVSIAEGNAATTTFAFTVSLSSPAPAGGVTFTIATADGTAQDGNPATEDNDYGAQSLTSQTITAGNTSYTFNVTVNGDTLVESNETVTVNVSNVTGANVTDGVGQGTIQNDDTPLLVISQVYGGGGNAGATYTNDFIEIFNRGTTTIDFSVTPYSVQYAAATSNFTTNKTDITSGIVLPGQYFMVQEGSGGAAGIALPTPDATGTINLAATAGKVALVSGTVALTGSGCPLGATIVDLLGYGATANCSETAPIAVSGTNSNARSVIRTVSCSDTNNNSADFSNPVTAPVARNTATTPAPCP